MAEPTKHPQLSFGRSQRFLVQDRTTRPLMRRLLLPHVKSLPMPARCKNAGPACEAVPSSQESAERQRLAADLRTSGGCVFSRRGTAVAIVSAAIAATALVQPRYATAAEDAISDQDLRESILLNSSVVPALTTAEYLQAIRRAQPLAWEQVERDIEAESFDQTSASLLFGPFDEVVQSAFFLPWAILKTDVKAAARAREVYLALERDVQQLKATADLGAKLMVEAEDVQAALGTVAQDLDNLLHIAEGSLL